MMYLTPTTFRPLVLLFLTTLSLSLLSCDLVGESEDTDSTVQTGIYVGNQGNFGDGNGSVTTYNPDTQQSHPMAVSGLGSIVQGIAVRDTSLLVMANSAARVDVFSTNGPTQTAQITGLTAPRYAAFTGPHTAYVTDQSFTARSAVRVLDLSASPPQVVSTIRVSGLPDGIAVADDRAYAALGAFSDTSLVAAIDVPQNTLAEEIDVGCFSREVVADTDGEVFVLCTDRAEAVILDGTTGDIQTRLSLPDTAETAFGVGHPASYAPEAQELYVATDTDLLRIDTETNTVETTVDVNLSSPAGAVAYNAARQELYVAHVPSFTEQGTVTIHTRNGEQTDSFQAGIAPVYIDIQRIEH